MRQRPPVWRREAVKEDLIYIAHCLGVDLPRNATVGEARATVYGLAERVRQQREERARLRTEEGLRMLGVGIPDRGPRP